MKSNEVRQRHSQVPQKDKERVNCQLLRHNEATQRPQKDFTRLSPRRQKPDTTASPRLDAQVSSLFTSGKNQTKPNKNEHITQTVNAHQTNTSNYDHGDAHNCKTWTNINLVPYSVIKATNGNMGKESNIIFQFQRGKKKKRKRVKI